MNLWVWIRGRVALRKDDQKQAGENLEIKLGSLLQSQQGTYLAHHFDWTYGKTPE